MNNKDLWKLDSKERIRVLGYKGFVGSLWDELGQLQFDFLRRQGLAPVHVLLDIGCGSLRGGRFFIEYLDEGNYLGVELHKELVESGIDKELDTTVYRTKKPSFVSNRDFDFREFAKKPDFGLAQSVFTHLTSDDIGKCLSNLYEFVETGFVLYFTFNRGESESRNPGSSHENRVFVYRLETIKELSTSIGWKFNYIGHWNHPMNQKIVEITKC